MINKFYFILFLKNKIKINNDRQAAARAHQMGHDIAWNIYIYIYIDNLHGIFVNSCVLLLILDVPVDCRANCKVISSLHLLTSLRQIPLISMSMVSIKC